MVSFEILVFSKEIFIFSRKVLEKLSKVTLEDLKRVGKEYFSRLFSMEQSNCAICCHPSKVTEIKDAFEK